MTLFDNDWGKAVDEPTVIGKLPPEAAIAKLREAGDDATADELQDEQLLAMSFGARTQRNKCEGF